MSWSSKRMRSRERSGKAVASTSHQHYTGTGIRSKATPKLTLHTLTLLLRATWTTHNSYTSMISLRFTILTAYPQRTRLPVRRQGVSTASCCSASQKTTRRCHPRSSERRALFRGPFRFCAPAPAWALTWSPCMHDSIDASDAEKGTSCMTKGQQRGSRCHSRTMPLDTNWTRLRCTDPAGREFAYISGQRWDANVCCDMPVSIRLRQPAHLEAPSWASSTQDRMVFMLRCSILPLFRMSVRISSAAAPMTPAIAAAASITSQLRRQQHQCCNQPAQAAC